MKIYDLLRLSESVCKTLDMNNIKATDARYLRMYEDWVRMRKEGHKYDFIVHYLSTQYEISPSTVERITRRLNRDARL